MINSDIAVLVFGGISIGIWCSIMLAVYLFTRRWK